MKVIGTLLFTTFSVTVHTLSSRYDIGKVTDRKEFSKTKLLSAATVKVSSENKMVIVTFYQGNNFENFDFKSFRKKNFSQSKNIGENRFCLNLLGKKLFEFQNGTFS